MRILWVDDNPANNRNIMGIFSENEVVFNLAKSTDEAIEKTDQKYLYINNLGHEKGRFSRRVD